MIRIITLLPFLAACIFLSAQGPVEFNVELKEITFPGLPTLQSYARAQGQDGKWLLIGGRTDGLHKRRPFEAFLQNGNNQMLYVIDPAGKSVWSAPLTSLSASLQEQLQSTNMEFVQVDDTLYLFGGYGYSPTAQKHITFPYLTAINVNPLIDAVINEEPFISFIHQKEDERFQITGGYAGYLNGLFYLVGGQKFMGSYNPMGPNHGPGFAQEYSNAVKRFKLHLNGGQITVEGYSEEMDTVYLHKRDYNLVPQIFPDGSEGFTAFSGVFRYDANLPWLHSTDIRENRYTPRNDFSQLLNQYHTAHLPLYDRDAQIMHTLFFGGIGQYAYDPETGELINDEEVPFVKTISRISRYPNDSVVESEMPDAMPGYLGASAEFLPAPNAPWHNGDIFELSDMGSDKVLAGYLFGGIESTVPNSFFSNATGLSHASNRLFEVYINNTVPTGREWLHLNESTHLKMEVFPNPANGRIQVKFFIAKAMHPYLYLYDETGKVIKAYNFGQLMAGEYVHNISPDDLSLSPGTYLLKLTNGRVEETSKLIIQ